jgi:hypothetical protein
LKKKKTSDGEEKGKDRTRHRGNGEKRESKVSLLPQEEPHRGRRKPSERRWLFAEEEKLLSGERGEQMKTYLLCNGQHLVLNSK